MESSTVYDGSGGWLDELATRIIRSASFVPCREETGCTWDFTAIEAIDTEGAVPHMEEEYIKSWWRGNSRRHRREVHGDSGNCGRFHDVR